MNPLDKLTAIIARLMGKEPSDPNVLEAVVEVVMVMRTPSDEMIEAGRLSGWMRSFEARDTWQAMIDALLTEGEG